MRLFQKVFQKGNLLKNLLSKAAQKENSLKKYSEFFVLADEALYYSTIYPNCVTWVQRTQAWPSAKSARRLAFGQTKSYSVQPLLQLAATIGPHPWW